MSQPQGSEERAGGHPGPWQFGLRDLLFLPLAMAMSLGVFIVGYPFSLMTLCPAILILLVLLAIKVARPSAICLWETVVISVLCYAGMTLLGSGCIDPSGPARQMTCANNLKQIMLALHKYHATCGSLPPAFVADQSGRPMHSWRVLILPFLEQQAVYDQYRFDEPWDGPNNRKLAGIRIGVFACPEQGFKDCQTSYVAVVQSGGAWPGPRSIRLEDIRDDTHDTLMVVEMAGSGIHWMEPRDLDGQTMAMTVNPSHGQGISSLHRASSWDRRLLGAHAGMADGSVRFLPTDTPEEEIRAMLTIDGQETIEADGPPDPRPGSRRR